MTERSQTTDRLTKAVEECRKAMVYVPNYSRDNCIKAITPVLRELCEEIEACRHLSNIHEGMWLHAEEEIDRLKAEILMLRKVMIHG